MIITNTRDIYEALSRGDHITFGKSGKLESQDPRSFLGWLFGRPAPVAGIPQIGSDDIFIALERVIENDPTRQGPQDLTQPLPQGLGQGPVDVQTQANAAKELLAKVMLEAHVDVCLEDEPEPVKNGAKHYIGNLWEKSGHGGDPPSFPDLKAFVEEHIQDLKDKELLGITAFGYVREGEDLKNERTYLEEGLIEVVKDTWSEKHKGDFDARGVYEIFVKDSGRDRPNVFDVRLDHDHFNNDEAGKEYGNMLVKGLGGDPSMVGVVGVLMSQSSMVTQAEMIMGQDTPFPLMSFGGHFYQGDLLKLLTTVGGNGENDPRSTLTQTEDHINIRQVFTFDITSLDTGNATRNAGSFTYRIEIPKDQFPLPLGAEPKLTVSNMRYERVKPCPE